MKKPEIFWIIWGCPKHSRLTKETFQFSFSPGKHNELQKAVIEEFAPRFAPDSECLYVGDTIEKDLVKNVEKADQIGI